MNRGPSAFAPSRAGQGRNLTWESLIRPTTPVTIFNLFTTSGPGGATQRLSTMIPINVTRGVVTLERIRGSIQIWFRDADVVAAVDWFVHLSIQLVPARAGVVDLNSSLLSANASDVESNRFVWRKSYTAPLTSVSGILYTRCIQDNAFEIDVKSRRRFDRATWALVISAEGSANALAEHFIQVDLRALFRAPDAL